MIKGGQLHALLSNLRHKDLKMRQRYAKLSPSTWIRVKTRLLRARLMMRDELAPGFDGSWKKGQPYQTVRPW